MFMYAVCCFNTLYFFGSVYRKYPGIGEFSKNHFSKLLRELDKHALIGLKITD